MKKAIKQMVIGELHGGCDRIKKWSTRRRTRLEKRISDDCEEDVVLQKSDNEIAICLRSVIPNLFTVDIEIKSRQILKYQLKTSYVAYLDM